MSVFGMGMNNPQYYPGQMPGYNPNPAINPDSGGGQANMGSWYPYKQNYTGNSGAGWFGGGAGGFQAPQAPEFQGFNYDPYQNPGYQQGDQWGQGQYQLPESNAMQLGLEGNAPTSAANTQAQIQAQVPLLQQQLNKAYADVGARFGGGGTFGGTDFAQALGGAAGNASNQFNAMALQTANQAAQQDATRALQAQQGALDRSLGAYQTHAGMGHQGQLQDLGTDFGAWQQQGDWGYGQNALMNQFNQTNWQQQGNWGMQNAQMQNQQDTQLMGMLGNIIGGLF
jgi:hypothetical protein